MFIFLTWILPSIVWLVVLWRAPLGTDDKRCPTLSWCQHLWHNSLLVARQKALATRVLPRSPVSRNSFRIFGSSYILYLYRNACLQSVSHSISSFLKQVWSDAKMLAPESWAAPFFCWAGLQDISDILCFHRGALCPRECHLCERQMCRSIPLSVVITRSRWWWGRHMTDGYTIKPLLRNIVELSKQQSILRPIVFHCLAIERPPDIFLLLPKLHYYRTLYCYFKWLDCEEFLVWHSVRARSLVPQTSDRWQPCSGENPPVAFRPKPDFWVEIFKNQDPTCFCMGNWGIEFCRLRDHRKFRSGNVQDKQGSPGTRPLI